MVYRTELLRIFRQVGWGMALTLLVTLSLTSAGKNPPPPAPMTLLLADGLNVVTAQGTKLELYKQVSVGSDVFFKDSWTESTYGGAPVVFADLDGDQRPEIVVGRSCSVGKGRSLTYGHFLNVFKDRVAGLWETTYDETSQWVMTPTTGERLAAHQLDDEPGDEIIMLAPPRLAILGLRNGGLVQKASFDLEALSQAVAGTSLTYRSLDIGDINSDGVVEILMAASFRATQQGDDQEFLIALQYLPPYLPPSAFHVMFSLDLYDNLESTGDRIGSFCITELRLADLDGDQEKEIWAAGWQNHWELVPTQYDQKVFGWKFDALDTLKLKRVAFLDVEAAGYSLQLGPHMAVGDYTGDKVDDIIIQRHDPRSSDAFPHRIEVNSRDTDGTPILSATYQYPDRRVTQMVVRDGRLFVIGFIPATPGMRYFFDILAPSGSDPFSRLFSVSGSGELDGLAVAKGIQ